MQSDPLQTASVDGQYNYHDFGRQHQQYQQFEPQLQLQLQLQLQQQHQQDVKQQSQAIVFPPNPHGFLPTKTEESQNSSLQLYQIPHISTASAQTHRVQTAYNTQAIRKYHHGQHRQGNHRRPRQYTYSPKNLKQVQGQSQQQQNHKHQHNNHQCLCRLHNSSPKHASNPRHRPVRLSREREAALRCWLSEYIDAGEIQGGEIVNLDEVEQKSEMDEPFPRTPTSPNSITLSSSQASNDPVSDCNNRLNKDRDGQQTLPTFEVKGEAGQNDAALWGLVPFNAQEQAHALSQMQSSFGPGQDLFPYSSTLMQPVSPSHLHMISMPAIQEGQQTQFDPLVTGYHQHNMGLVGEAFEQNCHQQQGSGVGYYTSPPDSNRMSNCMSFSSMSTESAEGQHTGLDSVSRSRECSGVNMARTHSNIENAANTSFTSQAQGSIHELPVAAPVMSRSASTRTLAASESSREAQQLPFVDPSLASAMSHSAPMQHSLSAQSASSGSSFVSHSTTYPLYAPLMIPTAFYGTGPVLGEAQTQYLGVQRASNKRPASSMGSHLTSQHASKRRMDEYAMVKEEQPSTPCSSGKTGESSFNFDDYIDLASSQRITDVSATGSTMGPAIVRHNGPFEQAMPTDLMHSIEVLSSQAALHTTLVTAVTPPPHNLEHNGTVSPRDLFINPLGDAQPVTKRESTAASQPCMTVLSREEGSFFAEFDPALVGGYRGRSAAHDGNVTELDYGTQGVDDFYPYGSSHGSPRIPHPSPASDMSPPPFHNQNRETTGQDYTHVPMVDGRDVHTYEHRHSVYPPCSEARAPSQPHSNSSHSSHDAYALQGPETLSVPRSAMEPMSAAETELARMRAAEEQRFAERERHRKDQILLQLKREGYTYREIRAKGNFTEAESTLRGRYRTLTKSKQERVRKPTWTPNDDHLLIEAVDFMARGRTIGNFKVAWKAVSERIVDNGGSYRFGNTTCRKRYDLLVEQGLIRNSRRGSEDNYEDDEDEDDEDDEPSVVYFNEDN